MQLIVPQSDCPCGRAGWGAGTAPKQLLLILPAARELSGLVLGRLIPFLVFRTARHEDLTPTQCNLQ